MDTQLVCQSCSMPMKDTADCGTEVSGAHNHEYCEHCYSKGAFTKPDATLESMVEAYAVIWGASVGDFEMPLEQAKKELYDILSTLKRWKKKRCCCSCKCQ